MRRPLTRLARWLRRCWPPRESAAADLAAAGRSRPAGGASGALGVLQVLAGSEAALQRAHRLAGAAAQADAVAASAVHWLLDNYYLLQEQAKECRLGLVPASRDALLPQVLADDGGRTVTAPRIFLLMRELVMQQACALDWPVVQHFVARVQQQTPLQLAELWLVPVMLRLALLERLAQVARALGQRLQQDAASGARDQESESAAAATLMRDAIGSLRFIGRAPWSDLVEQLSSVEQTLRRDPAGVYAHMDFSTRARYRRELVRCARRSGHSEQDVAELVLATAGQAPADGDPAAHHVGYWLLGPGQHRFAQQLGLRETLPQRMRRWLWRWPSWFYLGAIAAISADVAWLAIAQVPTLGKLHAVLTGLAVFVAATHLAVALVNWLATLALPPQALPRMDFSAGVPSRWRTLVAVPCMLTSAQEVAALAAALERRYLGNRDANIFYALVSDFADAPQQRMPDDDALRDAARAAIAALNAQYGTAGAPPPFALLHRDRRHNKCERLWMGWERKRGKLIALNRFLRGQGSADVHLLVGDAVALQGTAFVITLDVDTQLPPETAQRLIATLAHPLNRPVWDARRGRVARGYGVLQPRVSVGALRGDASALARLYSDEITLDPYSGIVSDVYQDLFGEASYIGKGIYDVDSFLHAVGERFPDNLILSHDLLEGSYARTGLVSDVELFEYHPDSYAADMQRRHRWTRGDWQIWPWLLPHVPGPGKRWQANGLSVHQRWKLLDNLRRSLVPAALLFVLVNGWLLTEQPLFWTVVALLVLFASPLLVSVNELLSRSQRMPWRTHWHLVRQANRRRLLQAALPLVMLPFEAVLYLDAVFSSQWRMWVLRRRRLQWTPAQQSARGAARSVADFYHLMWVAPAVAIALAIPVAWLLLAGGHARVLVALPLLALWLAAPWLAWRLSTRTTQRPPQRLDAVQQRWLRQVARRSWHFFEVTVGPHSHALPPDNFQEIPQPQLARRTSPTNIGMYLLSCLSAWDFGYLSRQQLLDRVDATLATLEALPRYRGHFYNWYDTGTLQPLLPAYVSTVDSGNLMACLLLLARGLQELEQAPPLPSQAWQGLRDSWQVLREIAASIDDPPLQTVLDLLAESTRQIDAIVLPDSTCEQPLPTQARQLRALDAALLHMQSVLAASAPAAAPTSGQMPTQLAAESETLSALRHWLACLQGQSAAWIQALACGTGAAARADSGGQASEADCSLQAAQAEQQASPGQTQTLAARCRALAQADFDFLYRPEQKLLTIGYHPDSGVRDAGVYDLLASEARLGSFVAIAQGKLPLEHWLALSRLLVAAGDGAALLSWSGSMFEYLMPQLLVPSIENTLLTRSCRNVIARQIAYGRQKGVPWGISESAYNHVDASGTYQYRGFGVPGLGLRRGLERDLVIAPYASALALMQRPQAALRNLQRLAQLGALGRYGFYEALDYTPRRRPAGADFALVRTYMAHHQGMLFNALSAALNGFALQRRFMREPMFAAYRLLLEEKIPAAFSLDVVTLHTAHASRAPAPNTGG